MKKLVDLGYDVLTRYAGKYDVNGSPVTITLKDSTLIVNPFGNVKWQLYFTSDTDFFVRESRGMARFRISKDNEVLGFMSDGQLVRKIQ